MLQISTFYHHTIIILSSLLPLSSSLIMRNRIMPVQYYYANIHGVTSHKIIFIITHWIFGMIVAMCSYNWAQNQESQLAVSPTAPSGSRPPHYRGFMIALRHTTVGTTSLDEWSSDTRTSTWQHTMIIWHKDLYLTTHNTHDRHLCLRWDSNPRSHQPSGRRPTPQTARTLGYNLLVHTNIWAGNWLLS
jgi:hypothetical protein